MRKLLLSIMQHDYQKMSIKTRPLNLCMFNPNKKMVMLNFYTCVDSLTVLPIEYRIFKHKKRGYKYGVTFLFGIIVLTAEQMRKEIYAFKIQKESSR